MTRLLRFLLVGPAILVAEGSRGDVPAKDNKSPEATLPVGTWTVEFTNGVTQSQASESSPSWAFGPSLWALLRL
jgi:hypothetical protein